MSREGKVTVVGAGFYGSTTAQRLAEFDIFDEVVMTDIVEGKPEGIALDISQSRPIEGFETHVVGVTTGPTAAATSAPPTRTSWSSPRPAAQAGHEPDGPDRDQRQDRPLGGRELAKFSPNAVIVVVSNPLDEMTALTSNVTGFPKARVVGQAGMLDTARFKQKVADQLGVPTSSVEAITLGSHGDTMVPVPSLVTVDGKPLSEVLDSETVDELVKQTREGGAEIVALLKTGSAYYAPSAAAARMVKAIHEDSGDGCRCAPGSTASTASTASTSVSPRASAPAASRRSSSCR